MKNNACLLYRCYLNTIHPFIWALDFAWSLMKPYNDRKPWAIFFWLLCFNTRFVLSVCFWLIASRSNKLVMMCVEHDWPPAKSNIMLHPWRGSTTFYQMLMFKLNVSHFHIVSHKWSENDYNLFRWLTLKKVTLKWRKC